MKKYVVVFAIAVILATVCYAVCPAPFEKAKEMSLKVPIDYAGRHIVIMSLDKNGNRIVYFVGYIPRYRVIGIGKLIGNQETVYEYYEKTSEYKIREQGEEKPIEPERCIREAFLIFREMVAGELI